MTPWSHHNPVKVYGGSLGRLGDYLEGGTVLLVTTAGSIRRQTAEIVMAAAPAAHWLTRIAEPNPDLDALDRLAEALRPEKIAAVTALGGGSALDSGKALAALLAHPAGWTLSRQLRAEKPRPLTAALPLFCVPTTAGTGSELTPFATIWDRAQGQKRSLSDTLLYPQAAFLEPGLTLSLTWRETLWGGLDCASHALETLWNKNATAFSLALARESLNLVNAYLPVLQNKPGDLAAREKMQTASALAGLAISQNRTAVAHAMSYPLTLHFGVPHGLACAFALPSLAALVTAKDKWLNLEDQKLAGQTAALIKEWNLPAYIKEYCRPGDIYNLAGAMRSPGRSENFILPDTDIQSLLKDSLEIKGRGPGRP